MNENETKEIFIWKENDLNTADGIKILVEISKENSMYSWRFLENTTVRLLWL